MNEKPCKMSFLSDSDSELELIDNIRAPKARKFKNRFNYLEELDESEFLRRFRISKDTFRFLCNEISDEISPETDR